MTRTQVLLPEMDVISKVIGLPCEAVTYVRYGHLCHKQLAGAMTNSPDDDSAQADLDCTTWVNDDCTGQSEVTNGVWYYHSTPAKEGFTFQSMQCSRDANASMNETFDIKYAVLEV